MKEIESLYQAATRLIHQRIRQEMLAQGHHLTGAMEESLDSDIGSKAKAVILEGFAVDYTRFVNEGFPASSASFKQVPFLIEYFKKRGYAEREATSFAFATVKKWMKEGMPTQASKRFSRTGSRTNMIESAFIGAEPELDELMSNGLDFVVEERFQKEKSETI